jgi:hypothetical protein
MPLVMVKKTKYKEKANDKAQEKRIQSWRWDDMT